MPSVRSVRARVAATGARAAAARARHALRAVAFWTAVALPVAVIAVLAVGGDPTLVGALLACNVAALVVGHGYGDDRASTARGSSRDR